MRQRVVPDRMAPRRQFRNLRRTHRLPVLPLLVAGPGVWINSRPVKSESLVSGLHSAKAGTTKNTPRPPNDSSSGAATV